MQKILLRKAEKKDVEKLVKILKESNYTSNKININSLSSEEIKNFIANNLEFFTLYFINDKIEAFSIAYSLKDTIDKTLFRPKSSIIKKIRDIFSKESLTSITTNDFLIEFIYFNESIHRNNNIFIKFLEMEKLNKKCSKIVFG